ncbi:MAG: gamma-glutamylcyclotransferase [Deltaproteobacteria bacterium]|nr:gamma-glutamylcyclotransferase [Deltaproteobacteria bacterium]
MLLFVYGSLLRGERNHHMLQKAPFAGEGRTVRSFELVDLGPYPALLPGGSTSVVGELFAVPDELLLELDAFEDEREYARREIELLDGRRVFAYVYHASALTGSARVRSGDWRSRGSAE